MNQQSPTTNSSNTKTEVTPKEQFRVGDYVTLCPLEFDGCEYDGVWRIQILKDNICFVTTVEDYIEIDQANPPLKIKVLPEHIELDELRLATKDEIDSDLRTI